MGDRIVEKSDDRNCVCGLFEIEHNGGAKDHNQIWMAVNYLTSKFRIMLGTSFAGISLDQKILPLDIPQASKLLENAARRWRLVAPLLEIRRWGRSMNDRDAVNFSALLRLSTAHRGKGQ